MIETLLKRETIKKTLDAMYWCFSPYLDDFQNYKEIEEPWIVLLIDSYNDIVEELGGEFEDHTKIE